MYHTCVFFEGALLCFPTVILRYASTVGVLLDKALFLTSLPSMHLQLYDRMYIQRARVSTCVVVDDAGGVAGVASASKGQLRRGAGRVDLT